MNIQSRGLSSYREIAAALLGFPLGHARMLPGHVPTCEGSDKPMPNMTMRNYVSRMLLVNPIMGQI